MSAGVPVKVNLDGAVFLELERIARRNDTTIAALLAEAGRRIAGTPVARKPRGRRREWDNAVVDEWVVAHRMGVSARVIAERYRCSPTTVLNRLAERGLTT